MPPSPPTRCTLSHESPSAGRRVANSRCCPRQGERSLQATSSKRPRPSRAPAREVQEEPHPAHGHAFSLRPTRSPWLNPPPAARRGRPGRGRAPPPSGELVGVHARSGRGCGGLLDAEQQDLGVRQQLGQRGRQRDRAALPGRGHLAPEGARHRPAHRRIGRTVGARPEGLPSETGRSRRGPERRVAAQVLDEQALRLLGVHARWGAQVDDSGGGPVHGGGHLRHRLAVDRQHRRRRPRPHEVGDRATAPGQRGDTSSSPRPRRSVRRRMPPRPTSRRGPARRRSSPPSRRAGSPAP